MSRPNDDERPAGRDAAQIADFLERLAHDLRSPIGVVAESLAQMRADSVGPQTDDNRALSTLVDRGVRRLQRIAGTVNLVAALEARTFELRRSQVDLVALVRAAAASSVAVEPRREVTIEHDLPTDPCLVDADTDALGRAVTEILINAIRNARRNVRLHLESAGDVALVDVSDDGQGVPVAAREVIFRRFAPRPSRSGLGLGLSIAHDVAVAHGGTLTLEDSRLPPGRPGTTGARFVLSLPISGVRPNA